MEWLLICNTNVFDMHKAFDETDVITWPQLERIVVGDIAYLYLSSPYKAVCYKCEVWKTDVYKMNDVSSKYVLHPLFYDNKQTYIELKLLESFPDGLISEKELKESGVMSLQTSSILSEKTVDYIESKINPKNLKIKKAAAFIGIAIITVIAVVSFVGKGNVKVEEIPQQEATVEQTYQDENVLETQNIDDFVEEWAKAFSGRNVDYIVANTTEKGQEKYENQGLLLTYENIKSLGWSSPWPMGKKPYEISEIGDDYAIIYYTAMVSDPHLSIWRDVIHFEKQEDGRYLVTDSQFNMYEQIDSSVDFYEAYPNGIISGTPVDYLENGYGEKLNNNAKEDSDYSDYQKLFSPETAARCLLNLSEDEELVDVSIISGKQEERIDERVVKITFADDESFVVQMKQAFGTNGIWIPQTTVASNADYEIVIGDLSWEEAKSACEVKGGHLATITSEKEYQEICALADESGLSYLWLGGDLSAVRELSSGNSVWLDVAWITGEPWTFDNWYPGEPSFQDVDGTREEYLCLWKAKYQNQNLGWTFNDQRNDIVGASYSISGNIGYICEYE